MLQPRLEFPDEWPVFFGVCKKDLNAIARLENDITCVVEPEPSQAVDINIGSSSQIAID